MDFLFVLEHHIANIKDRWVISNHVLNPAFIQRWVVLELYLAELDVLHQEQMLLHILLPYPRACLRSKEMTHICS